jgi:hypothetical protein
MRADWCRLRSLAFRYIYVVLLTYCNLWLRRLPGFWPNEAKFLRRINDRLRPHRWRELGHWEKDPRRVDVPGWGPMPLFDFIYRSNGQATKGKLPTTVLSGNSFSDLVFNVGLQTYFKEFYRARNVAPRWVKSLRNLPPGTRYVVYQFFAPFLSTDMDQSNLMSLAADEEPAQSPSKPADPEKSAMSPLN